MAAEPRDRVKPARSRAEKVRWEKVLGKFKRSELPKIARKYLGLTSLPHVESKRELVSVLVDWCSEDDFTPSDLLELELACKPLLVITRRVGTAC